LPYALELRDHVDRLFEKLMRKGRKQLEAITKKVAEICENPYKFKPLRAPMQNIRRVHIGSFVLTYSVNEMTKVIIIEDYAHHDDIY